MTAWGYSFGGGAADGDASIKNLLGGKGANLAEMSALGLPVPPGFTITTEACVHYYAHERTYPETLEAQVAAGLSKIEGETGKTSRVLCSTIGAATDLKSEDLRKLFVNAAYFLTGQAVPKQVDVAPVGEFEPLMFGFNKFKKGVKVSDHELK